MPEDSSRPAGIDPSRSTVKMAKAWRVADSRSQMILDNRLIYLYLLFPFWMSPGTSAAALPSHQ